MYPRLLSVALVGVPLLTMIDLHAQGSLRPPGPPGATQKSLQELCNNRGAVEQQNTALQTMVATLRTSAAQQPFSLTRIFRNQLPWRRTTADAAGKIRISQ